MWYVLVEDGTSQEEQWGKFDQISKWGPLTHKLRTQIIGAIWKCLFKRGSLMAIAPKLKWRGSVEKANAGGCDV